MDANGEDQQYDYNRFRFENRTYLDNFSTILIVDNDTVIGSKYLNSIDDSQLYSPEDVPFEISKKLASNPYDRVKVYRALAKYEGEQHAFVFGLQRVAFGVGRIWTPTDMFNPLKSLSLESAQRPPVLAAYYSYAFSDTGSLELVTSRRKNGENKAALRVKEYMLFADVGLIVVKEENRELYGYEFEGHLFDTGIEVRSEGGLFKNTKDDVSFKKFIIGADYAFEEPLSITLEYLHNETDYNEVGYPNFSKDSFTDVIMHKDSNYMAAMASYGFSTLLNSALILMQNIDDGSNILVPTLMYSLSDESTLNVGGFVGYGSTSSEFGNTPNLLYVSVSITF